MQNVDQFVSHITLKERQPLLKENFQQAVCNFEIHTLDWFKENRLLQENEIKKSGSYEFLWIRRGSGVLAVDLQDHEIKDKTVYCLSPGQLRYLDTACNIDGYYISLSPDFFYMAEPGFEFSFLTSKYEVVKNPVIIQMDDEGQDELEEILFKMRKEFLNHTSLGLEIIKGLFKIFLLYLSRNFVVKEYPVLNRRDKEMVRKFMCLLSNNFTTKKMVIDYAGELCVTPSYLNQVVKKVSGCTASHHIQQYVILEAKRQAIHSDRSMKEIAYGLGFDDIAHFSKFFKTNSGLNFTSFKKGISLYNSGSS